MKHIYCYSGGHSSALVAIEGVRRNGREDAILLNHDLHFTVEHADVKRFKNEVADYLGLPITYANYKNPNLDQFDICVAERAFKGKDSPEICTSRLKTRPFQAWLRANAADRDCIIYYGFDDTAKERGRMQKRIGIMAADGYRTDYPLALWSDRTIHATEEIGIARPSTYDTFIHGNCIGCLKAGWQHWYIVYCTREDIWLKAKWAEDEIGYAIHHDENGQQFLEDWEPRFAAMKAAGIVPTERTPHQRFWADARKIVKIHNVAKEKPCEVCTG
jgi:3'-phosphoadenosine 5'-phosphosulfate sulfotransferase (PAPS reductase)/FAD synthetase